MYTGNEIKEADGIGFCLGWLMGTGQRWVLALLLSLAVKIQQGDSKSVQRVNQEAKITCLSKKFQKHRASTWKVYYKMWIFIFLYISLISTNVVGLNSSWKMVIAAYGFLRLSVLHEKIDIRCQ